MSNSASSIEFHADIRADPRWELVERIVVSATFIKSPRLCSILLFVCELSLLGRDDEISELNIGATVFGRAHNYDPSIDGIVRSHASRLRHRLEQYFNEEGAAETLRLSIPKGGYVPLFEQKRLAWPTEEAELTSPLTSATLDGPASSEAQLNRRLLWLLSVALVVADRKSVV